MNQWASSWGCRLKRYRRKSLKEAGLEAAFFDPKSPASLGRGLLSKRPLSPEEMNQVIALGFGAPVKATFVQCGDQAEFVKVVSFIDALVAPDSWNADKEKLMVVFVEE